MSDRRKKIWLSLAVAVVALVAMLVFAGIASATRVCDTLQTRGTEVSIQEPAQGPVTNALGGPHVDQTCIVPPADRP